MMIMVREIYDCRQFLKNQAFTLNPIKILKYLKLEALLSV